MNSLAASTTKDFRHAVRLCLLIALALLAAEGLGRFVVPRISNVERSVNEARNSTFAHARQPAIRPLLLLTGNSLMRSSLDVDSLRRQLPAVDVQPYIFESTQYLDWYYGLQHLFESGLRPAAVTLMLSPRQLLSDQLRGTYSALQLFSAAGSLRAGRDAGLHRTEIASLLVGHYSAYYGDRLEIRKFAFSKLVPEAERLTGRLLARAPTPIPVAPADIQAKGAQRLQAVQSLCLYYGVRCIFLTPPELEPSTARSSLVAIATQVGLEAAAIEPEQSWGSEFFDSDRFHFSRTGATAYTDLLAQRMPQLLGLPDACCILPAAVTN